MTVKEAIERLKKLPPELDIVKFDGDIIESVSMIYVYPGGIYNIKGKVVID